MGREFGVSRCKLLYIGWINNQVLLNSTGNYKQYPAINHHGGVPVVAQWLTNPTSIHEDAGSIPGLAQWVKNLVLP